MPLEAISRHHRPVELGRHSPLSVDENPTVDQLFFDPSTATVQNSGAT
jgi:hypothetical protein